MYDREKRYGYIVPADRSTDLRFAGRNVVDARLSDLASSVLVEFLEDRHSSRDNVSLFVFVCVCLTRVL